MAVLTTDEVRNAVELASRRPKLSVSDALTCVNLLEEVRRRLGHDHPESGNIYQLGVRILASMKPQEEPEQDHRFMPWTTNHRVCAACGFSSEAHVAYGLRANLEAIRESGGA